MVVVTDVFFIPAKFYQDNADAVLSEGPINSFPSLLVVLCMWTTQAVEKRTKGGALPRGKVYSTYAGLLKADSSSRPPLKLQFQNISNASQLLPKSAHWIAN